MPASHPPDPSDPESVGAATFDTRRRGFDPMQVRAYLTVVSRELQRLRERERELTATVAELREARETEVAPAAFDEARAVELLGEETTRVLSAARSAAADKLERAETRAREIVTAAEQDAVAIRSGAYAAVEEEIAGARVDGRAIIAEAKLVRERMLDDLAAKRQQARTQLEQMRAGRDRLAESYQQIRAALDEVAAALEEALPAAQIAARRASARLVGQPRPDAAAIEREIDEAARAGMPIVTNAEVEAELAQADEEEPAQWVNDGTPPPVTDELFGAWDDAESGFFLGETPTGRLDADAVPGEAEHHEILLAEVTKSRRDAGLPREAVPILDPPDAVEVVRVLRSGDAPAAPVTRAEPEGLDATADESNESDDSTEEPLVDATPTTEITEITQVTEVTEITVVTTVIEETVIEEAVIEETVIEEPRPATPVVSPRVAEQTPVVIVEPELELEPEPEPMVQPEPVAIVEPEPEPEPEPVAIEPEPEPVAIEPEPVAAEPEPEAPPTAEPERPARRARRSPLAEVAAAAAAAPMGPPATPEPEAPAVVDDLFARIRRTREAKVAQAEAVLRDTAPERPSVGAPRPTEAAAPAAPAAAGPPEVMVDDDRLGAPLVGDAAWFASRDEVLDPVQAQIVRKLKRLLADEQNDVLDLVRRAGGQIAHDDIVPSATDHTGRFVAAIGGELLAAVGAGAAFFGEGAGAADADFASLDACVHDVLVVPLRVLLERSMAGDVAEDELLDRLRSAYRESKGRRIDDASASIACAAFNVGVAAAHPTARVRWAVDPAQGCCADCDDNALEGEVEAGTPFPTGAVRPPGHAGCRCLLVPARQ